jgi:hypothetical protein
MTEAIEALKVCPKCNTGKPLSEYHNNRSNPGGKAYYCKPCNSACSKPKTKEQSTRDCKNYRLKNPDKQKALWEKYYKENKEALKAKRRVYDATPERIASLQAYRGSVKERTNELRRARRKNPSPRQKVEKVLRDRFHKVIVKMKSGIKHCSWRELVGCDLTFLKWYLEDNFLEGMSWENHGNGDGKWNIDHIRPLCTYDLMCLEEQKQAFHYTNVRPLWFIDNMRRKRKQYSEGMD